MMREKHWPGARHVDGLRKALVIILVPQGLAQCQFCSPFFHSARNFKLRGGL